MILKPHLNTGREAAKLLKVLEELAEAKGRAVILGALNTGNRVHAWACDARTGHRRPIPGKELDEAAKDAGWIRNGDTFTPIPKKKKEPKEVEQPEK